MILPPSADQRIFDLMKAATRPTPPRSPVLEVERFIEETQRGR